MDILYWIISIFYYVKILYNFGVIEYIIQIIKLIYLIYNKLIKGKCF